MLQLALITENWIQACFGPNADPVPGVVGDLEAGVLPCPYRHIGLRDGFFIRLLAANELTKCPAMGLRCAETESLFKGGVDPCDQPT